MSTRLRLWALILGIILAIVLPCSASALGVGATPGKLDFSTRPGGVQTQTLYVVNQSEAESTFQVYVEGDNKEWFRVSPSEFTLRPQEVMTVEIALAPPFTASSSEHDVSICVVSIPTGSDLGIAAGIKVQTHVQITGPPFMAIQWWILSAVLLVAVVIAVSVWIFRRSHLRRVTHKAGEVD